MAIKVKDDIAASYGVALIERSLLRDLATLWEGPLDPACVNRIETVLRAFLVAPVLTVSRIDLPWDVMDDPARDDSTDWAEPIGDGILDYEFTHPGTAHALAELDSEEASFLDAHVTRQVTERAQKAIPPWVKKTGEALAYLDAWYAGFPTEACEYFAREMRLHENDDDAREPWPPSGDRLLSHIFIGGPAQHAHYLVGAHRAGLTVYGDSPVYNVCAEHIFSNWPHQIFRGSEEEYRETLRMIRGPGIAIDLPPILAVLLSRTENRADIPSVLLRMREEYAEGRRNLWKTLEQMWQEPTLERQLVHARKLKDAATAVFSAAFPERFDALELGLGLAQITPSGAAQFLRALRERDKPNARVSAFSFTKRLAQDIRSIENARTVLRRHLTQAELRQFGI